MKAQTRYDTTEWTRLPLPRERLEGCSRSHLYLLIQSGAITSVAIRAKGAERAGQRLVNLPSLRAWINKHVDCHDSDTAMKEVQS